MTHRALAPRAGSVAGRGPRLREGPVDLRHQVVRRTGPSRHRPRTSPVSVVIPVWKGGEQLAKCLESVAAQTIPPKETILVQNDARRDRPIPRSLLKGLNHVIYLPQDTNLGFCGAVNLGISRSTGKWVMLLNQDVWLEAGYLEAILAFTQVAPHLGILTGTLISDRTHSPRPTPVLDSTGQFLSLALHPQDRGYKCSLHTLSPEGFVFSACAAATLYRKEMLEDIAVRGQPFDESFFAYFDDLDVAWRAQLRGWTAYFVPTAMASHDRGAVFRREGIHRWKFTEKPSWVQAHVLVNHLSMLFKNAGWWTLIIHSPFILGRNLALWCMALRHPEAIAHALRLALKSWPRALRDRSQIQGSRIKSERYIRSWIR